MAWRCGAARAMSVGREDPREDPVVACDFAETDDLAESDDLAEREDLPETDGLANAEALAVVPATGPPTRNSAKTRPLPRR